MSKHHIIIGDGVTAAEFATTRKICAGERLTIIGPNVEHLGRGVAYATAASGTPWRYAYLLNSPARSVDLAFSEWMQINWHDVVEKMSGCKPDWLSAAKPYIEHGEIASLNAPREIYGDYFHECVREKLAALRNRHVDIQLLPTRVTDVEPIANTFKITMENGSQLSADSVDIATGGPQNQRFDGDDDACSFPELFGNESHIMEKLGGNGSIICIGASAAMLDLLRFCQSVQNETDINFTAISPSGKVLTPLIPETNSFNPAQYELNGTFACAEDFLNAVKSLRTNALAAGHNFYEARVGIRSLFIKKSLNEFLPNLTEARKVSVPLFNYFQGGTRDSVNDFNRLLVNGKTRIIAGRVTNIDSRNNMATVTFTDSDGKSQQQSASVVVNCAGPGRANQFDTLTNHMLRRNWITICDQSGGILVGDKAQTNIDGIRYLGPAVTSIGDKVQPVPLYDAFRLRLAVQQLNHQQET